MHHIPRIPIDDSDKIAESMSEADIGDVGSPDVIGICGDNVFQQVRIDGMQIIRFAGVLLLPLAFARDD